MMMAALGVAGVLLCGASPAWGARGYHRMALVSIAVGAALAMAAALVVMSA